jgi:HEAT repeat protein
MTKIVAIMLLAWAGGMLRAMGEEDVSVDGKPLSELLKQLKSENRGFQMRAARALSEAPTNARPQIIEQVLPVLKSPRENDKFVAAQVLGACGPIARAAIPDLLPMLKGTQYERNRAAAAKALGQILKDAQPGKEVEEVTDALAAKFNEDYDSYSDVRRESVFALGMIGPAAKRCIAKLGRALTDYREYSEEHYMVRRAAAWTTGRMGPLAAEHMDRLIAMMHGEGARTPEIVAAIGNIGPVNDNVAPNMVDFMETGPGWTMVETWQVLQKFGPKAELAIPFAKRILTNPSFYGQNDRQKRQLAVIEAMKFLQVAGPKAVDVLPQVESLINYKYPYGEKHEETVLMQKEAAKTAGILKGMAGVNTKEVAPGGQK